MQVLPGLLNPVRYREPKQKRRALWTTLLLLLGSVVAAFGLLWSPPTPGRGQLITSGVCPLADASNASRCLFCHVWGEWRRRDPAGVCCWMNVTAALSRSREKCGGYRTKGPTEQKDPS